MPTTKSNGTQVPINSDTFNLTGDLGTMGESITSIVPVASQSAGDTVATNRAAAGFAVADAKPLFIYNTTTKTIQVKDSSGWRDMNSPLGLLQKKRVTGATSNLTTAVSVVDNFASQLFVAGRHYRLSWSIENYSSTTSGTYWGASIQTCSTADAANVTTGMTSLVGYTFQTTTGSYGQSGYVQAFYDPTVTGSLQIKFTGQVVVNTAETISSYTCAIEDVGAAF